MDVINTIGRRKASVARVYMSEGKGAITVNEQTVRRVLCFSRVMDTMLTLPLTVCDAIGKYDIQG